MPSEHPDNWLPGAEDKDATESSEGTPVRFLATTVDGLGYNPTQQERERDAEQLAATGRRSYKTLKGVGEAVWSPALEWALIKGLTQYMETEAPTPTASKNGYRFPLRNRYISNYIWETEKKYRSAKQVGSRLQQLRDTCQDPDLLALISGSKLLKAARRYRSRSPKVECKEEPTSPSPRSSLVPDIGSYPSTLYLSTLIHFPSQFIPTVPRIRLDGNDTEHPPISLLSSPQQLAGGDRPSPLAFCSNLVDISSPWQLQLQTEWVVYHRKSEVYRATTNMRGGSSYQSRYACDIVPAFWDALCQLEDLKEVEIIQILKTDPYSLQSSSTVVDVSSMAPTDITIRYHFEWERPVSYGKLHPSSKLYDSSPVDSSASSSSYSRSGASSSPPGSVDHVNGGLQGYDSWRSDNSNYQPRDTFVHQPSLASDYAFDQPLSTTQGGSYALCNQRGGSYHGTDDFGTHMDHLASSSHYDYSRPSTQWSTPQSLVLPHNNYRETLAYGHDRSGYY